MKIQLGNWTVPAALAVVLSAPDARIIAAAEPAGFSGELSVVFWKALVRHPNDADPANLIVELEAEDGRWGRAFGLAQHVTKGVIEGVVTRGEVAGDEFRLRVDLKIGSDPWSPGGYAGYDVVARRGSGGALEGTFEGSFRGNKASGRITGVVKPPRPVRVKDFTPVSPDEHPRVLFRKSDLPALREKLKTPFGQTYLAKAGAKTGLAPWAWDLINISVLHQLTGDASHAANAKLIVERHLKDPERFVSDRGAGSGGWGHSLVETALAMDLCWDAWPTDFRKQIEDRLMEELPHLLRVVSVTSHPNMHPCSNYYGPGVGAPALAALALWGGKGPEPAKPSDPLAKPRELEPPADFTPGKGVPVLEFAPGRTPPAWLMAGPLPVFTAGDPLAFLGGCGRARPAEGVPVELFTMAEGKPKVAKSEFRALAGAADANAGVDLSKLAGPDQPLTIVLFAALKVGAQQDLGFIRNGPNVRGWLAGAELGESDYYRLKPGLYPLTVVYSSEKPAGRVAPFFDLPGSEALKPRHAKVEMEMSLWKLDHDYWTTTGGCDPKREWLVFVGRQRCYHHYRLGVGDGGWQAEAGPHYSDIALWYPLNFATAYLKMFGRDASPYPDVTHVVPRRMMQVLFGQGKPAAQPLSSSAGFDLDKVSAAFPIVPEKYKPAVLWGWKNAAGDKLLAEGGLRLANSFLHYPLDLKPEHPAEVMPLTWQAPTFGFECFRSGWQSKDDFVGQVFLKASLVKGWNHPDAGAFRLYGLGHPWVVGSCSRVGFREHEPCVLLPLDDTAVGNCGRLAFRQTAPDGSGTVTVDLRDVYASAGSKLYDSNLLRLPEGFVDAGIRGLRAVAFDYSGKCGAPCLLVLVDRISGGRERWWQWTLDEEAARRAKATGNGFSIDYGDASLKATFITPAQPKVEVLSENVRLGQIGNAHHSYEGPLHRVKVSGKEHFFVVATIQRKAPPEVKVEGAGLDAVVTIGGQSLRFDGEKIVFSEKGAGPPNRGQTTN